MDTLDSCLRNNTQHKSAENTNDFDIGNIIHGSGVIIICKVLDFAFDLAGDGYS